jgi:hypothetical protein
MKLENVRECSKRYTVVHKEKEKRKILLGAECIIIIGHCADGISSYPLVQSFASKNKA